ncbi:MAG: 2OG-Fe(II) oxygenase, partial [Variovorax sp.]|nr:2OG-Fe(II) oxygenase [Variovorax sp.]
MTSPATSRVDALDWPRIDADLATRGCAAIGALFTPKECAALAAMYEQPPHFRSRVVMQRHGFGQGEYQYFANPLPAKLVAFRSALYERLAPLANAWAAAMGQPADYPPDHAAYLARCHAAGQLRPTPLLLRYDEGDYNCLHQDLYGDLQFPLQLTVLLSRPGEDFTGGEFVLTEQRPRKQSRAEVVTLGLGQGVIFAVHERPVLGN